MNESFYIAKKMEIEYNSGKRCEMIILIVLLRFNNNLNWIRDEKIQASTTRLLAAKLKNSDRMRVSALKNSKILPVNLTPEERLPRSLYSHRFYAI